MLPAAVFAGSNNRSPIPMRFSTLRFSSPTGGFTDSAPVRAKVCASCGFIFHYIEMPPAGRRSSTDHLVIDEDLQVRAVTDEVQASEPAEDPPAEE